MDKDKILNDILAEWAMRSPDGLVGGHDTPENFDVLEEIMLDRYGLTGSEFDALTERGREKGSVSKKYIVKNEKGEEVIGGKYPHYKYPPGTKIADIKAGKKVPTLAQYNKKQTSKELSDEERAERISKDKYTDYAASNGKRAGNIAAKWMRSAIESNKEAGQEFLRMYDSLSLDEAIGVYNNSKYKSIIDGVEGTGKEKKGLGRGELVFVWLMKGYRSGGTREVDLVFGSIEKDIEMKELTGKSKQPIINISAPTLKGYYNTNFRLGIDELATEIRRSGNKGISIDDSKSYDFNQNPSLATFLIHVFENYPGPSGGDRTKMLRSLVNFCSLLRTTEMPTNLFNALAEIGVKLSGTSNAPTADQSSASNNKTAKAVVVVGGEKEEFAIDPIDAKTELDAIASGQKATLDLDVKSSADTKTLKDYEGEAKSLIYFKQKYTIDKISKELRTLLKGKYSGLIVIDKRGGINKAEFVSASAEFIFLSLGLNKINFVLPGEEKNVKDDDGETKV